MESAIWSVEVKPNESFKFTVGDEFLYITKAALGEVKSGKEVEGFPVYWNSINCGSIKEVLVTLSSERAPQAITQVVMYPFEIIELSHGWKDGSVHISGHIVKCLGLEHFHDVVYGEDKPKASLKDLTEEEEEEQENCSSCKKRKLKNITKGKSVQTTKECMDIVECFQGFEEGSSGYTQALIVFLNESARVHFMIPKMNTTRMEFLKAVIAHQGNKPTDITN